MDPVVGWLVCIEGADQGRDYRLRSGRNVIGRGLQMQVPIGGDPAVLPENHAVVGYEPAHRRFRLIPMAGKEHVAVNGQRVQQPVELQPFDAIAVGKTVLLFVPCCGEHFAWRHDGLR